MTRRPRTALDGATEPDEQRHTVDTITSDALDALYESLEAAQESELYRQLRSADNAFASATVRAAKAEAAIERVRAELAVIDRDVRGKTPVALAGIRHTSSRIRAALDATPETDRA